MKTLFLTKTWMRTASLWLALFFIIKAFNFMLLFSVAIYLIFRLVNTVGYHRYFCHNAFECSKLMQWVFGILGCISLQNSPMRWAITHASHHKFSDTEKDPYKKIFTYLIQINNPKIDYIPHSFIRQLRENKMHRFLDNYSFGLSLAYGILCFCVGINAFIFGYIIPVGLLVITDGIHNTFAHTKTGATNRVILEFMLPMLGEWAHKDHHKNPRTIKFSKLDLGYYFIGLIKK